MSNVKPFGNRLLVKPLRDPLEKGGLIMPVKKETVELMEAEVIACGDKANALFLNGDVVLFEFFDKPMVRIDYQDFYLIEDRDVLAITTADKGIENLSERVTVVCGNDLFLDWEEANDNLLGGLLIKSPKFTKAHYTGIVKMVGEGVEKGEIEEGQRVFFQQFSDFKFWYEGGKRYAIVPFHHTMAVIPQRDTELEHVI